MTDVPKPPQPAAAGLPARAPARASRVRQALAWGVHFYTGLGLVCAAGIALAIFDGQFPLAFLLMFIATVIDATDGTLARLVRVKEVLPGFDGRRLDDLIDFHTYTTLPLLLIWRAEILPHGHAGWLLVPVLASAYGFSQVSAKTSDGYFLGFPSYWNLVAFYLYVLQPIPEGLSLGLLLLFSVLTFVPSRYLYPTQRGPLSKLTNALGVVWGVLLIAVLWRLAAETGTGPRPVGDTPRTLALISLAFPAYYLAASWIISLRFWLAGRRRRRG